jgi:hypothetical protein
MTLITGIHVVRSETSTPQPEACAQKGMSLAPRGKCCYVQVLDESGYLSPSQVLDFNMLIL